jgi:uncharacterized membrane protein YhaH (DUF805 family)
MHLPELFDYRGRSGRSTFGLTLIFVFLVMHNLFRLASAGATASRYAPDSITCFPWGCSLSNG